MADAIPTAAWPWIVVLVGAAATYTWRALGVALSGRIDPEGTVFRWVGCIAYAVLAGLIARMILLPVGSLAETPAWHRLAAAGAGLVVFYLVRRNLPLGVVAGGATLIALSFAS